MAIPLIINGVTFNYPQQGDVNWGPTLTNWSSAVTNALQVTSNNFTLLTNHDIVFKDSEGTPKSLTLGIPSPLTATWVLTLPVNAGTVGQVLSTDGAGVTSWINAAGGGTINSGTTGQLAYYPGNGTTLSGETISGDATIAAGGALTIANDAITNVKVAAAAAIAVTKLAALTASRVVTSDGSGFLTTTASPTLTELGYVGGVTSAIQTQLNTLTSNQANYLPLAGGTMSGQISMGSNKIISITQGSSTGEAISFPVGTTQISNLAITTALIAANAITQMVTGTTSVTFTTTGGYVMVFAQVDQSITSATGVAGFVGFDATLNIIRDGSVGIYTARQANGGLVTGKSCIVSFAGSGLDSPTAASHTYVASVSVGTGTNNGAIATSIYAIEFKK